MALSSKTVKEIAGLLTTTVREKLRTYQPETVHMPFHHRLFGKYRYAMFSFIQSMNTTFGMSIWEQIAVILAKGVNNYAERQHRLLGEVDAGTEKFISEIHYRLRKGEIATSKNNEVEQIRSVIKKGEAKVDPDSIVALKLKLLRWTALRLSQDKNANVLTRLAIPYNPYHPEPYERWTLKGLYDLENGEILVGEEFWNFVASSDIYVELLNVFQKVGEELRKEIDKKFAELRRGG